MALYAKICWDTYIIRRTRVFKYLSINNQVSLFTIFHDIPQLVFAVLTEKTGFMELLFVCYQAFHGVNPLLAHCTHLRLWYSNLARDI